MRTVSATGGEKGVKPERMDLIPPSALLELSRVYGAGAAKYSDTNYLRGTDWRKMIGAMKRHIALFEAGFDCDGDEIQDFAARNEALFSGQYTGLHHLAHAAWHCMTLMTFQEFDLGDDDRIEPALRRGDEMGENAVRLTLQADTRQAEDILDDLRRRIDEEYA